MVMLIKVIRKSVSLLACMLVVAVTPTYVLILCSASQCNQRNHDYEQAFIANQQSEGGKCDNSSTDEAEDASKATKEKDDPADDTWEQTRDKKVTELLSERPSDQKREVTYLDDTSSISSEETEEAYFAADSTIRDVSEAAKRKVDKPDNTWRNQALIQEMIEALNRGLYSGLDNNIPSMEETEETYFAADSIVRNVSEAAKGKVDQTDNTWRNKALTQEMIENLKQVAASNIPLQSIITQHPFKDDVSLLSLFESLSVRFSGSNCVQSCNEDLCESIKWYQGNEDCEKSLTRLIPLLDKHSETQRNKK